MLEYFFIVSTIINVQKINVEIIVISAAIISAPSPGNKICIKIEDTINIKIVNDIDIKNFFNPSKYNPPLKLYKYYICSIYI